MDVVGSDEIQTNRARSSTRQMIEELVVKEAERTIGICDILMEPSTNTMSSSISIQSSSSEDDTSVSTDNVAVTVTHTLSTAKVPRLPQKYNWIFNENSVLDSPVTARKQYPRYIELSRHGQLKHDNNPLRFGKNIYLNFWLLALLAKHILSVPASSAPVKRVFSQGGIIIWQHQSSMTSNADIF